MARIIDLWEQNAFELIVSEKVLSEYDRVLHYPRHRRKHQLTDAQLVEINEAFWEFAVFVTPDETPHVVEDDPDDDHFLACADSGEADCIVTGDPHLLRFGSYKGVLILSPADFLTRFFAGTTESG